MAKNEKLTPEQENELPIFRQRYLDIACGGGRIDRSKLEAGIAEAYAIIGKPAPKVFIFDSPAECMLALRIFEMAGSGDFDLGADLGDNLRDNLWANLWDNLGANLGDNLRDNLGANLWANLRDNLRANLGANLWANLRDNLGANLGDNLRDNLWANLWTNLRDNLRDNLGADLGDNLWDNLGANLRDNLWDNLGANLWANLRDNLRANLYNGNFLWGSQDLFWIAHYRFAHNIGVPFSAENLRKLDTMEAISTQCEWWWPFENIVIASQRPTVTKWDEERRLHSENGPAVEYAGGYGFAMWHGQRIPLEWVNGNPPAAAEALSWENLDQRSAACEIVGWHNILDELDAKMIEDSGDHVWGRLVEVELPDNGPQRMLDAMCGTGRRFALLVPNYVTTVDQAQSVLHGDIPAEILRNSVTRT